MLDEAKQRARAWAEALIEWAATESMKDMDVARWREFEATDAAFRAALQDVATAAKEGR